MPQGKSLKVPLKLKRKLFPQRVFFTSKGEKGMLKLFRFTECSVKEKVMKTGHKLTNAVYQGWTRCLAISSLCQDSQRGYSYTLLCFWSCNITVTLLLACKLPACKLCIDEIANGISEKSQNCIFWTSTRQTACALQKQTQHTRCVRTLLLPSANVWLEKILSCLWIGYLS